MSENGREGREWRLFIQDMIEFSEKVLAYTAGLNQCAFVTDSRTYDATLRNLALIGEAATHVPRDARQAHPETVPTCQLFDISPNSLT